MPSEAEVKCDFCGYEYPSVRRSCPKCSQNGPTGNPYPPQAEVVGEMLTAITVTTLPSGIRLRFAKEGRWAELTMSIAEAALLIQTMEHHLPEPPPAQGKENIPTPPAAKCDGSGTIIDEGSAPVDCYTPCPGCSTCKPEPKDGAEEAGSGVVEVDGARYGQHTIREMRDELAAIRADREKQAARQPAEGTSTIERYRMEVRQGQPVRVPDPAGQYVYFADHLAAARPATGLRGKVKELCEFTIQLTDRDMVTHQLAREVLAQLEGA